VSENLIDKAPNPEKVEPHPFVYNWMLGNYCRHTVWFVGKPLSCGLTESDPIHVGPPIEEKP
jgi:hypothetical protein